MAETASSEAASRQKILPRQALADRCREARSAGRRVVFTNGCFDLLHVGHVRYLTAARAMGDLLVVGLNSDASVRRIKGDRRPVVPEGERAEVLSALTCVDSITIFGEPDPLALIEAVRPEILVKGADWPEDRIVGAGFVKSIGGRVARVAVVPSISTTRLIERIIGIYKTRPEAGG